MTEKEFKDKIYAYLESKSAQYESTNSKLNLGENIEEVFKIIDVLEDLNGENQN